jgi:hypothetical protein
MSDYRARSTPPFPAGGRANRLAESGVARAQWPSLDDIKPVAVAAVPATRRISEHERYAASPYRRGTVEKNQSQIARRARSRLSISAQVLQLHTLWVLPASPGSVFSCSLTTRMAVASSRTGPGCDLRLRLMSRVPHEATWAFDRLGVRTAGAEPLPMRRSRGRAGDSMRSSLKLTCALGLRTLTVGLEFGGARLNRLVGRIRRAVRSTTTRSGSVGDPGHLGQPPSAANLVHFAGPISSCCGARPTCLQCATEGSLRSGDRQGSGRPGCRLAGERGPGRVRRSFPRRRAFVNNVPRPSTTQAR